MQGRHSRISGAAVPLILIAGLGGCGGNGGSGSGGSGSGGSGNSSGYGTAYAFVPPVQNTTRIYAETVVDNSNTTINIAFSDTVTSVNSDGSATQLQESTIGSPIVNGTNYTIATETQTYDATGHETAYTDLSEQPAVTCTFDPYGEGPDWPVQVGQTWSIDYTFVCGSNAGVAYSQSGTVVDVESVTVPAGTFTALKLQSTLTWTDSQGTARTQTTTNWRDVATSYSVKEEVSIAVSGTLPTTGYAVSRQLVLESIS
jgi:hypothetical protein